MARSLMERSSLECVKKNRSILNFLRILLLAFLPLSSCFFVVSPASALDFDLESSGYIDWSQNTRFWNRDGGTATCQFGNFDDNGSTSNANYRGLKGLRCQSSGQFTQISLDAGKYLPAGSIVTFNYYYDSQNDGVTNNLFQPYSDGSFMILANQATGFPRWFTSDTNGNGGYNSTTGYNFTNVYQMTVLVLRSTNLITFTVQDTTPYVGIAHSLYIFDGSYVVTKNSADVSSAIESQTQKQEEHWQQEQEQRAEDENKANETGDGSKSDADSAQSDVDDASKGIFDILGSFTGAITGASAGSCSISGDFGFFNVGGIDLCTGASKITPITNVVGAVMLIGLTIPACITLLHRFVDLYNEVMG